MSSTDIIITMGHHGVYKPGGGGGGQGQIHTCIGPTVKKDINFDYKKLITCSLFTFSLNNQLVHALL